VIIHGAAKDGPEHAKKNKVMTSRWCNIIHIFTIGPCGLQRISIARSGTKIEPIHYEREVEEEMGGYLSFSTDIG
jgi:hypothetical protein